MEQYDPYKSAESAGVDLKDSLLRVYERKTAQELQSLGVTPEVWEKIKDEEAAGTLTMAKWMNVYGVPVELRKEAELMRGMDDIPEGSKNVLEDPDVDVLEEDSDLDEAA